MVGLKGGRRELGRLLRRCVSGRPLPFAWMGTPESSSSSSSRCEEGATLLASACSLWVALVVESDWVAE